VVTDADQGSCRIRNAISDIFRVTEEGRWMGTNTKEHDIVEQGGLLEGSSTAGLKCHRERHYLSDFQSIRPLEFKRVYSHL
jgi:hypothetical protein